MKTLLKNNRIKITSKKMYASEKVAHVKLTFIKSEIEIALFVEERFAIAIVPVPMFTWPTAFIWSHYYTDIKLRLFKWDIGIYSIFKYNKNK